MMNARKSATARKKRLSHTRLRHTVSPDLLGFKNPDKLNGLRRGEVIGQPKAIDALEFGLAADVPGYNCVIAGKPGSGRTTTARIMCEKAAQNRAGAPDICILHNFENPQRPFAFELEAGQGKVFQKDMDKFLDKLPGKFMNMAKSTDFLKVVKQLENDAQDEIGLLQSEYDINLRQRDLRQIRISLPQSGIIAIVKNADPKTNEGIHALIARPSDKTSNAKEGSAPIKPPVPQYIFTVNAMEQLCLFAGPEKLAEDIKKGSPENPGVPPAQLFEMCLEKGVISEKEAASTKQDLLDEKNNLLELQQRISDIYTSLQDRCQQAEKDMFASMVRRISQTTFESRPYYKNNIARGHIWRVIDEITDDLDLIAPPAPVSSPNAQAQMQQIQMMGAYGDPLDTFRVNLYTSNKPGKVPVITAENLTHDALFGGIDLPGSRMAEPDHLMIKPGTFAKANGGFLIINLKDMSMHVWQTLNRILRNNEFHIHNHDPYGMNPIKGLDPKPFPVNVKVVLIMDYELYGALLHHDPEDFGNNFQVLAQFDTRMKLNKNNVMKLARFVKTLEKRHGLPCFDRSAIEFLTEYSMELAGDKELSTSFSKIRSLAIEAGIWARKHGAGRIDEKIMNLAQAAQCLRSSLAQEHSLDTIERGYRYIETRGKRVGQLNALAVYSGGGCQFGLPFLVTVNTSKHGGGYISIDQNSGMSGRIFNKSFATIKSYLARKFAQTMTPSMSVNLSFEQSYGGIDGDSASLASVCAILSELSGVGIDQGLAITGSMNQRGRAQAIGGVNEKIEGFYDVCRLQGLTGSQGVVIPSANIPHLMLRRDIVEMARQKRFHIYAVDTVEEAVEIMTGVCSGKANANDSFPANTVYGLALAKIKKYSSSGKRKDKGKDNK